tara:strand:+ start:118 stop:318 length:201 start_codon:yes stop_codon:yes gene_type:complete
MVNATAALRSARHVGIRAVADLPNLSNPLKRRRSRSRRRIFLFIGLVAGIVVVAALVWGCIDRESR